MIGTILLGKFGRKTLMVTWTAVQTVMLVVMGIAAMPSHSGVGSWNTIELIFTLGFVAAFEFA